jgi:hypothetical protein
MKLKLLLLVGLFVMVSASAFGNSKPARSTGSYGVPGNIELTDTLSNGSGFEEVVVCQPPNTEGCSSGPYDLLLAFTGPESNAPFTLNLPGFTEQDTTIISQDGTDNSLNFGILFCGGQAAVSDPNTNVSFCSALVNGLPTTAETACENALSATQFNGEVPANCAQNGITLYFDETNPNTLPTPESATLVLLGPGLAALLALARRRLQV